MESLRNSRGMVLTIAVALTAVLGCAIVPGAQGQTQEQKPGNPPRKYSMAEYNDYAEAVRSEDAAERIKQLDSFVAKHPDSPLLSYVYQEYYKAYEKTGNLPKVMEYVEKRLSIGSALTYQNREPEERLETALVWVHAYNKFHSDDVELAAKARAMVRTGLAIIATIKKPDYIYEEKIFTRAMIQAASYLNATSAKAARTMKDYKAADESLEEIIRLTAFDLSDLWPPPTPTMIPQ
jgi:tetratricopeptide (TPR) repeat protein